MVVIAPPLWEHRPSPCLFAHIAVRSTPNQVFEPGVVLADGEFTGLESVILGAPIDMTNNYMTAVAYNEVRSLAGKGSGNKSGSAW